MVHQLQGIQWLFLDLSILLNEGETDREFRRQIAAVLSRRGRAVEQEQVERAWMASITAPQAIMPEVGTVQSLAGTPAAAAAVLEEVTRTARNLDTLNPGVQLALSALQSRFRMGVIAPYRTGPLRPRLVKFHLNFPVMALCDEQQLSHRLGPSVRPDPALFVWALRKAGVPASQAAFASDRADLGLAPAKAAGMTTIWLRQTNYKLRVPRNTQETPDLTYNSLSDLAQAVR